MNSVRLNSVFGFLFLCAVPAYAVQTSSTKKPPSTEKTNPVCKSLQEAKTAYRAEEVSEARSILHCLVKAYPNDLDNHQYLSDIEWWEGETAAAESAAR